jgi:hypothetical protein
MSDYTSEFRTVAKLAYVDLQTIFYIMSRHSEKEDGDELLGAVNWRDKRQTVLFVVSNLINSLFTNTYKVVSWSVQFARRLRPRSLVFLWKKLQFSVDWWEGFGVLKAGGRYSYH